MFLLLLLSRLCHCDFMHVYLFGWNLQYSFIYLFGVLRRFQHCTGHITTGSWKGRGNQYIEFARVVYCKLLTNGKQLPAFPLKAVTGIEPRPQRWEARVLPLCHRGPLSTASNPFSLVLYMKTNWNKCRSFDFFTLSIHIAREICYTRVVLI